MSDKQSKLKPCPFCGGEAKLHKGLVAFNDCEVQCETCGFAGPNFGALDEVPNPIESAILHWNTRAAPKVNLVDVLQAAFSDLDLDYADFLSDHKAIKLSNIISEALK